MKDKIIIKGARQHNLKNIDLEIPKNKLVVITGLSGSGKSSLAFDTLYAEGQRRYVESLSSYARQFLQLMEKPDVDFIEGLSPAISIEQKTVSKNPRSTVGTTTEIHDYLRLLFARAGTPYCPNCDIPIQPQTIQEIVDRILKFEGKRILILSPVVREQKGEHKKLIERLEKQGFRRVRIDGKIYTIDEARELKLEKRVKHSIDVIVDRIKVKSSDKTRIADSVEIAVNLSEGLVVVLDYDTGNEETFSTKGACPECGFSFKEISPRLFSFNSPIGACTTCGGIGFKLKIDPDLLIDWDKPAIMAFNIAENSKFEYIKDMVATACEYLDIPIIKPIGELSEEELDFILFAEKGLVRVINTIGWSRGKYKPYYFEGIIKHLERRYAETESETVREYIEEYMREVPCDTCKGARLNREALSIKIEGLNIAEIEKMSIAEAFKFFENLNFEGKRKIIAERVLKEIKNRLKFLLDVGLDYLTLDRRTGTLSGGESQRIRLATQIGSKLTGVLYVLDEPSIGLHQRDNQRLINTLKELRDIGNTVIVVEHDTETIENADFIVDMGPGAGIHGGEVVATGTAEEIKINENSITGKYLSGKLKIPVPEKRRTPQGKALKVIGAKEHNLKNITVEFPLGLFICVTGVSGSGKSTLVNDILYRALSKEIYKSKTIPGKYEKIEGLEHIDKVINVDQSPIGRTPRSNPATYIGVFDLIRELFAATPEARARGYKKGRFSFNVPGGRCEACRGDGVIKVEMHFLPDVYVTCDVCGGKRYNRETLEITYKGKNIHDILEMSVEEALEFFKHHEKIVRKLKTLYDVGLSYIKLGQPATTLSGGEAQRIKLAKELSKRATGKTVYILDEPTTGLHIHDVKKLIEVLQKLVDMGNTVIVIEHNLDFIKCADYIIDLGPEGGDKGGKVVATGTPEEVAKMDTWTGRYLKKFLL
ncbi:excinuclease ABC subunit UvrA [Desulfurobacterium atlanticum]|uniref:UvrABC system protein A n=1 Tax=Desulfurobacterium atlanticum TaxID=240169 RepID=A0A238Y6U0_9BACT|nr:excinuclease ABC subunit UvrA [Desulfurobacterium atlanticum]SNR66827.1 excinuclease ABC subunit A [Desulfurobacterium atlanticum]